MYHVLQMRRGFSIFLILLFGFGPLSVLIDSEDAGLPACCRRHGAHHCAMAAMMQDAQSGRMPEMSAPVTCPLFPGASAAIATIAPALTTTTAALPAAVAEIFDAAPTSDVPLQIPARVHAGRGPPSLLS